MKIKMTVQQYIISLLLGDIGSGTENFVYYGKAYDELHENVKVIIVQSDFFDDGIYGTDKTFPKVPFEKLPETDIPFFFGKSLLEKDVYGRFILYSDIVASAYFMLSRYEEIVKPDCRDQYGRFLAKDSVVFQQGYGTRPLVDEWGLYLRNLLRKAGVEVIEEKYGFKKIYLTHDIDKPFYITSTKSVCKQCIKNILHKGIEIKHPIKSYIINQGDPFYTFPWINELDNNLKKDYKNGIVESIFFIITASKSKNNYYFPTTNYKYKRLLKVLLDNDSSFGLHVSLEAGENPLLIETEKDLLPNWISRTSLKSRHHYLSWREPEHIEQMQKAGINDDYTLGYADSVGFRCGTCHPYYFINPVTQVVSDVIIHPLLIMENSLQEKHYMALDEQNAFSVCKKIINEVEKYHGELVILFHNSSFIDNLYFKSLYKSLLEYISGFNTN